MYAIEKHRTRIVFSFFAVLLLAGLFTYKDYGLSWDESDSRDGNGMMNYNFIMDGDPQPLVEGSEKYHGPAFEIFLILLEKKFNLTELRDIYFMRHLVTFLFFYFSVFVFYHLCKNFFNSWKAGMAGALMLVLCPRIFADAFYNSKDLTFLSFFIFAMYSHFLFWKKRNLFSAVLHAVTTGVLISIRIMGIVMPVFFILAFIAEWLIMKRNPVRVINMIVYLLLFPVITVLTWPVLWLGAWHHFVEAFLQMRRFYWDGVVLFRGALIDARQLPWDYVPVWVLITVPDIFILFFATGFLFLFKRYIRRPLHISSHRLNYFFIFLWLSAPVISVIFFHSIIYDAWRHLFFIYPAFVIIAVYGLWTMYQKALSKEGIFRSKTLRYAALSFLAIGFAEPAISTIKNHPFGNVYFNTTSRIIYKEMRPNFELDYWGLSYRKGLEYLLRSDTASVIRISSTDEPCILNMKMIPGPDIKRLEFVSMRGDADYFLTTCRSMPQPYSYKNEVFNVKSQGEKILFVYKLEQDDSK